MNEFVHVEFPTNRAVLVDGTRNGITNVTFVVQRGPHVFELGPPANFSPASRERTVAGTTKQDPLRMSFTPIVRGIRAAKQAAKKRSAKKGAAKKRATRKRAANKRGAKKARPR